MEAETLEAVLKQRFRLERAPTLAASTLSATPIAFTRLQCERAHHGLAGPVPPEDSTALQVALRPIRSWELRTSRGCAVPPPVKPGDVFMFNLSENPRVNWLEPFDVVRFYIAHAALEDLAYQRGLRRVGGLRVPATGSHDPLLHGMALALIACMTRPEEAQPRFVK